MLKAGGEMLDKVMFEEIIHPEKWINECYKELMEKNGIMRSSVVADTRRG